MRHWLSSYDDVQDVVQEICRKCLSKRDQLRDGSGFIAWLNTLIHHTCLDFLRERHHSHELPEAVLGEEAFQRAVEVKTRQQVAKASYQEAIHDQVWAALRLLKEEQSYLLVQKYIKGHSSSEIAEALGISPGNVRVKLHWARKAFEKVYRSLEQEE